MNEKGYRQKIEKALVKEGFFVYTPNDQRTSGVPDVLACFDGGFFAIEVKTSKEQDAVAKLNHPLSAQQSYTLREIASSGGLAIVAIGSDNKLGIVKASALTPGVSGALDVETWLCMEEFATWLKNTLEHSRRGI